MATAQGRPGQLIVVHSLIISLQEEENHQVILLYNRFVCIMCIAKWEHSVKNGNILLHFFPGRNKTPGRAVPKLSMRGAGQKTPGRKTPTTPFNQQDR